MEGVNCMMIMTFHGQSLQFYSSKVLPKIPGAGDLIDGHKVTVVTSKDNGMPIVYLTWVRGRATQTSTGAIPRGCSDSFPP